MGQELKTLVWIASAKKDLIGMPEDVQDTFGYALHLAQAGKKHEQAKPLKGFGIATPKPDLNLIRDRLKAAQAHAKGERK